MKLKISLFFIILISSFTGVKNLYGQPLTVQKKIEWIINDSIINAKSTGYSPYFSNEILDINKVPSYSFAVLLNQNNSNIEVQLLNEVYMPINSNLIRFDKNYIDTKINVSSKIAYQQKKPLAYISIVPLRKNPSNGNIEKLISFDVSIVYNSSEKKAVPNNTNRTYAANSVLATGDWY